MSNGWDWLGDWSQRSAAQFEENQMVKSFQEYLADLTSSPYLLSRNATQYLVEAMEHFGVEDGSASGSPITRFKLFDAPFAKASDQPLMGQEEPVLEIYTSLKNLVLEGRADRIIHLHGPNGSAKSLIVELLMRACEEYSRLPEGSLYTFHWVFPRPGERRMGFGSEDGGGGDSGADTYAHLSSEQLESRVACDMNDSPILLIPPRERLKLVSDLVRHIGGELAGRFVSTHHISDGDLCPRCRSIYDALLYDYGGDPLEVLRHVQIRRLFISRRYRRGAVVISPQETPDAGSRQITMDSSLSSLPDSLSHLNMDQLYGDLVDANNGLVEFSDFLTRAQELNKYLLSATERGEIGLPTANIYLNLVLFATSNERNLDAFKGLPDFASFKSRMLLVTVPYLLERRKEKSLYDPMIERISRIKHCAPHISSTASLWAVLTRLNRPSADRYTSEVQKLVSRLTPIQKAMLYDGELASHAWGFSSHETQVLKEALPEIRSEYENTPVYEGRFGASPREMREILYDTAYQRGSKCLTVPDLLDEMTDFIKDKSLYLFLQIENDSGYHDAALAIESARQEYLEVLDREVLADMELVPEGEYAKVFERYLAHVRAWLRNQKILNPATGVWEEPSAGLLEELEGLIGPVSDRRRFREDILSKVAAWSIENEGKPLDLITLFANEIEKVSKGYHDRSAAQVKQIGSDILLMGTDGFSGLPEHRKKSAEATLERMVSRHGYCPLCAPSQIAYLLEHRYQNA